jgi:hypothetical protein
MAAGAIGYRQAYSHWLRTGRWVRPYGPDGRELKFNPYHDPRNGQFTFAPGGPRSLSHIIVSDRQGNRSWIEGLPRNDAENREQTQGGPAPGGADKPSEQTRVQLAGRGRGPSMPRGGNARAFQDPMTLEQAFPGLRTAPGGAIVAVADGFLDLTGPARAATTELSRLWTNQLEQEIQALDPNYRLDTFGSPQTLQGQLNNIDLLRFQRAATYLRVKGDAKPLQGETLRLIQQSADVAYADGLKLLKARRLEPRLSNQEALGNYVDRQVRAALQRQYGRFGIDYSGAGPVRVNRREMNSSETDLTYRRPDARVGEIAFDVTLTAKTLKTPQVRGFFASDWRPSHVVIIRPSQLGNAHTYVISRPKDGQ